MESIRCILVHYGGQYILAVGEYRENSFLLGEDRKDGSPGRISCLRQCFQERIELYGFFFAIAFQILTGPVSEGKQGVIRKSSFDYHFVRYTPCGRLWVFYAPFG